MQAIMHIFQSRYSLVICTYIMHMFQSRYSLVICAYGKCIRSGELECQMFLHFSHSPFLICRAAKEASAYNRVECVCKCKEACCWWLCNIYLVCSGIYILLVNLTNVFCICLSYFLKRVYLRKIYIHLVEFLSHFLVHNQLSIDLFHFAYALWAMV